jgi:hypothetical protein
VADLNRDHTAGATLTPIGTATRSGLWTNIDTRQRVKIGLPNINAGGGTLMALDKLGAYLASCGRDHVVLSLAEIATIEGRSLPDSVMYPAFWSNSSHYARAWRGAGYRASRRGVSPDQVIFIREQKSPVSGRDADPSPARAKLFEAAADVILVGCVKTKADRPMPALRMPKISSVQVGGGIGSVFRRLGLWA